MRCSKCNHEAICYQPYSGQHLCQDHLVIDIEAKAKRTIRRNQWMLPGDHIAVALTGDAADDALLVFFQKLTAKRRDIRVSGIPVDQNDVDFSVITRSAGVTKIARAMTLESTAVHLLADILRGEADRCIHARSETPGSIPLISPFRHIPAKEIAAYARIHGIQRGIASFPTGNDPLHTDLTILLADYTGRHPAAPHAIVNLCDLPGHDGHDGRRYRRREREGGFCETEQLKKNPR